MSAFIRKDNTKSLLDEDSSISDVITEAFDNVELTTIGKLCLDARVSKSLTQEQASNLLKVRVKIIKDFENGDQIDLPGTAYKIGFVRSYARLLELDSDLLVKEFKENLEVNNFKEEYKFLSPEIHNNKILPIGALLSFFIALIIYSGWYYTDRNNKIDTVSVNGLEKKIEKKTEAYDNSYVIIEENFDPKNSFPSKIKNNNNEIKESMFEEKIDIAEIKKRFETQFFYEEFLSVPCGVLSGMIFENPSNSLMRFAFRTDQFLDRNFVWLRNWFRHVLISGTRR